MFVPFHLPIFTKHLHQTDHLTFVSTLSLVQSSTSNLYPIIKSVTSLSHGYAGHGWRNILFRRSDQVKQALPDICHIYE